MTTTVTLKTHDWPCAVTSNSSHNYEDGKRAGHGYSTMTEFVPAHSEGTFSVTDTTSVTFAELPKDATELPSNKNSTLGNAAAQLG